MARGFESKAVEDQRQIAQDEADARRLPRKTAGELELEKRREALAMSRTRIERELTAATHAARRSSLEAALIHLDLEIGKLESESS